GRLYTVHAGKVCRSSPLSPNATRAILGCRRRTDRWCSCFPTLGWNAIGRWRVTVEREAFVYTNGGAWRIIMVQGMEQMEVVAANDRFYAAIRSGDFATMDVLWSSRDAV